MNDNSHAHSHGHGHDHHHDGHEASHGSMKTYMIGFILSVILTAIPFYLVMSGSLTNKALLAGIVMGLGAIQVVVHMIYFLHMNTKSEGGWNMMALIFTIIVVVIALSGSLWVMHHLNTNMMPMSPEMMRNVP
ncbi:cytochrome o ubiquinol oxidase subunit IV [Agrobacterium vitis]|uniref:cytochrome o ubiquinol oxidase subunit IV n=1 Tax=Agrobacterium vitis TaxID=373 RepID=UPI000872D226|nr:cytochrome o ubiquinol oxidase subunit IV [Agrobacterium vitis]MCE6076575.1 cytochrome o ubiquinol oxidase subunit IV [Agrobacterium vitis]MCM2453370.1 cytochrome o ubiquinol oxidase subunit IV [Agrobacterium vitis]MCM2470949.1 cytochrome o ubiquinol oxidase subunit IV [Agrobacterium vitis]MUO70059.1 cytochrome o ubiquinol oxidase subunit IV [Agrobacterium vitis]MUO84861.1 cytochrome o ubiquinol oxidase subunit IV [Agrobacterium vitis]